MTIRKACTSFGWWLLGYQAINSVCHLKSDLILLLTEFGLVRVERSHTQTHLYIMIIQNTVAWQRDNHWALYQPEFQFKNQVVAHSSYRHHNTVQTTNAHVCCNDSESISQDKLWNLSLSNQLPQPELYCNQPLCIIVYLQQVTKKKDKITSLRETDRQTDTSVDFGIWFQITHSINRILLLFPFLGFKSFSEILNRIPCLS